MNYITYPVLKVFINNGIADTIWGHWVLSLDEYNELEENFKGITNNFIFEECE